MPETNRGEQLDRMLMIIREISAHKNGMTTLELADLTGASIRTIQRDINILICHLPLTMEKRGKDTFYFFSSDLKLPAELLKYDEAIALIALFQSVPHWSGTALGKSVESGLSKLKQLISPKELSFIRDEEPPIFIQKRGFVEYSKDWLKLFYKAVEECSRLELTYRAVDGKTKTWKADPLAVIEHNQAFYIVLGVCRYKSVRIIALSRVVSVKKTEEEFNPRDYKFNPDCIQKDAFGVWIDEPKKIRIKIFDWAATYVSERLWHPSQKIEKCKDGSIILSFKSGGMPEILHWVMSFGANAMVLEPKELKESVREQAFQTFRQYIPKVETKHFEKHYHYKCLANFGQAKGWTEEDGTVVELAPYLSLKPGDMIDVLENEQGLFFIKDGYEYSTQKFVLDELFEEIREKNEIRTKQIEHKEEK